MNRLIFAVAAIITACSSGGSRRGDSPGSTSAPLVCDVTLPSSCSDMSLRWADVEPIFEERCIGCHSGDPGGPWPLTSYEHAADWANEIRSQMSGMQHAAGRRGDRHAHRGARKDSPLGTLRRAKLTGVRVMSSRHVR